MLGAGLVKIMKSAQVFRESLDMMQFPGSNGGAGRTPRRGGHNNDIIIGRENFDRVEVKENGRTRQIEQLPIASGTGDIVAIYQENAPESMCNASNGEILNEFATDTVTEGLKVI